MTWPERGIDESSIRGTTKDIANLGEILDCAASKKPGSLLTIGSAYVSDPDYEILVDLRTERFDPSSEDPELKDLFS